jgi:hypothetical protein
VIARIAAPHLGIARGVPFDVGAGEIVEQDLELGAEQLAIALRQVVLERRLVRQEQIQAAVETIGVDALPLDAQDVIQRGAAVPPRFDGQLTARRAQPIDGQDRRDL